MIYCIFTNRCDPHPFSVANRTGDIFYVLYCNDPSCWRNEVKLAEFKLMRCAIGSLAQTRFQCNVKYYGVLRSRSSNESQFSVVLVSSSTTLNMVFLFPVIVIFSIIINKMNEIFLSMLIDIRYFVMQSIFSTNSHEIRLYSCFNRQWNISFYAQHVVSVETEIVVTL